MHRDNDMDIRDIRIRRIMGSGLMTCRGFVKVKTVYFRWVHGILLV